MELITSDALPAGNRLPSTRALANHLGVARMTVVEAYDWLSDQGYLVSRRGSGTVIQDVKLPLDSDRKLQRPPKLGSGNSSENKGDLKVDFRPGLPDLALFPRQQWTSTLKRIGRSLPSQALAYSDPLGSIRLRSAIAAYLRRTRGLQTDPCNVVITAGTAQAVDLLLRVRPQCRELIIEAPGPDVLKKLPSTYGVSLREIPIDSHGLRSDLLPENDGFVRCAYVIPSHQFPLGYAMSIERRLALLSWAIRTNSFILEDDYDSEFAFAGRPAVPLAKLDRSDRVIYTGTFSKTLAPSLRLGFMIAPSHLLEKISTFKWWIDHGGVTHLQDALAQWIEDGTFERHVQRMRRVYKRRYELLASELVNALGDRVRIVGDRVGMHVAVIVRTKCQSELIIARCCAKDVGVYLINGNVFGMARDERAFVLGFGNLHNKEIAYGIRTFAESVMAT
jgi:GntR family transcriptional regulator/MocR family aminotransferase